MIEFIETYSRDGVIRVCLKADGMPTAWARSSQDYTYTITVFPAGNALGKSRSCGNGSVRYHNFKSYEEAQTHATAWAKRKQAEERKRVKRPLLIERELVRLFTPSKA
jgi:hypothetical protein